jgi:hypothetical protein
VTAVRCLLSLTRGSICGADSPRFIRDSVVRAIVYALRVYCAFGDVPQLSACWMRRYLMHFFAALVGARAQYQGHNDRATAVPARGGAFCGKLLCTIHDALTAPARFSHQTTTTALDCAFFPNQLSGAVATVRISVHRVFYLRERWRHSYRYPFITLLRPHVDHMTCHNLPHQVTSVSTLLPSPRTCAHLLVQVKDEIRLTLRGLQDKAVAELEAAKREHRKALQVLYYKAGCATVAWCHCVSRICQRHNLCCVKSCAKCGTNVYRYQG